MRKNLRCIMFGSKLTAVVLNMDLNGWTETPPTQNALNHHKLHTCMDFGWHGSDAICENRRFRMGVYYNNIK